MGKTFSVIASVVTSLAALLAIVAFAADHPAQWQSIVHYVILGCEIAGGLLVVAGVVGFFANRPDVFFFLLRLIFRAITVAGFVAAMLYIVEPHVPRSTRQNLEIVFATVTVGGVILGWFASTLVLRLFGQRMVAGRR